LNAGELALNIKTFMEGADENSADYQSMLSYLHDSEKVIFLGFAFHEQNMKLLFPVKITEHHNKNNPSILISSRYYGTCYGISEDDQDVIKRNTKNMNSRVTDIKFCGTNVKCAGLFNSFWHSLSF
jgi:hypothetical protein